MIVRFGSDHDLLFLELIFRPLRMLWALATGKRMGRGGVMDMTDPVREAAAAIERDRALETARQNRARKRGARTSSMVSSSSGFNGRGGGRNLSGASDFSIHGHMRPGGADASTFMASSRLVMRSRSLATAHAAPRLSGARGRNGGKAGGGAEEQLHGQTEGGDQQPRTIVLTGADGQKVAHTATALCSKSLGRGSGGSDASRVSAVSCGGVGLGATTTPLTIAALNLKPHDDPSAANGSVAGGPQKSGGSRRPSSLVVAAAKNGGGLTGWRRMSQQRHGAAPLSAALTGEGDGRSTPVKSILNRNASVGAGAASAGATATAEAAFVSDDTEVHARMIAAERILEQQGSGAALQRRSSSGKRVSVSQHNDLPAAGGGGGSTASASSPEILIAPGGAAAAAMSSSGGHRKSIAWGDHQQEAPPASGPDHPPLVHQEATTATTAKEEEGSTMKPSLLRSSLSGGSRHGNYYGGARGGARPPSPLSRSTSSGFTTLLKRVPSGGRTTTSIHALLPDGIEKDTTLATLPPSSRPSLARASSSLRRLSSQKRAPGGGTISGSMHPPRISLTASGVPHSSLPPPPSAGPLRLSSRHIAGGGASRFTAALSHLLSTGGGHAAATGAIGITEAREAANPLRNPEIDSVFDETVEDAERLLRLRYIGVLLVHVAWVRGTTDRRAAGGWWRCPSLVVGSPRFTNRITLAASALWRQAHRLATGLLLAR